VGNKRGVGGNEISPKIKGSKPGNPIREGIEKRKKSPFWKNKNSNPFSRYACIRTQESD